MRTAVLLAIACASADAQAEPVEGRITVSRAIKGGTWKSDADARFARAPLIGDVVGRDGPCMLYRPVFGLGLSAGTIAITGTMQPITLEPSTSKAGVAYKRRDGEVPNPAFEDGATITIDASGGPDVPAFTASVTAPVALAGFVPPTSLSRRGYAATWTPSAGAEIMLVLIFADRRVTNGVGVMCRVPDTGSFTVPASTFALVPRPFDHAEVLVARIAETVETVGDARITIQAVSVVIWGPIAVEPTPPVTCTPCETTPRRFLSLGLGIGGGSRVGDVPPTSGATWRLQFGQRVGHGLHVVGEVDTVEADSLAASGYASESHGSLGAGVRWTPFEPRPERSRMPLTFSPFTDLTAFHLTAVVGAGNRVRLLAPGLTNQSVWGPMASLAVSLAELQGRDWTLGTEFREQLARYDGQIQRGWQLLMVADLNTW